MTQNSSHLSAKMSKADANRLYYESEKSKRDRILLRLNKGDAAKLDAACSILAISRSTFISRLVIPNLPSLAQTATPESSTLDEPSHPPSSAPVVADEFDQLFQSGS